MTFSTFNVKSATTAELVAFYNQYAVVPVKKFADRKTAERRVSALIEQEIEAARLAAPAPVAAAAAPATARPAMQASLKLDRTIQCLETGERWANALRMYRENPGWMTSAQEDRLTAVLYRAAKEGRRAELTINGRTFILVNV